MISVNSSPLISSIWIKRDNNFSHLYPTRRSCTKIYRLELKHLRQHIIPTFTISTISFRVNEGTSERLPLSHYLHIVGELESTVTYTELAEHLSCFTPGRHLNIVEIEGIRDLLDDSSEMKVLAALCILERYDDFNIHTKYLYMQNAFFSLKHQLISQNYYSSNIW